LKELCPSFPAHDTLLLENFPPSIGGSTPLIAFQDTQYAPRLLCPGLLKDPNFAGDVGGTLAPGGTFLGVRRMIWGEGSFSFRKDSKPLFVKFNSLNGDRFSYSVIEPPSPQYEVTSVHRESSKVHSEKMPLSAKQLSDGVELTVETPDVAPGAYLAALVHYYAKGKRISWNESEGENPLYVHPILLSPATNDTERISLTVHLKSFPPAEHIELTLYEVRDSGAPRRLETVKAPILTGGQA
ncbi:MAG: hypothetical protein J0M12_12430, partial [Deltaproteobacteria bacterium]|nr:hypothetical protein [Deltaproteobacteria bacterium]